MTFVKQSAAAKYKKAIELWGEDAQINMMIEESSELITELGKLIKYLLKLKRCKTDKQYAMVKLRAECEIADVEIMLEQMHYIFDGNYINRIKNDKLNRLEELIKGDSDAIYKKQKAKKSNK